MKAEEREEDEVEPDLNASAANVDIQVRRNDQEEDSAQLHPLVYARVKHPIQNQSPNDQVLFVSYPIISIA